VKFSLEWLSDFVDPAQAGGESVVRSLLDRAGLPVEGAEGEGHATVFDVEITPNRPDAMCHRGLAREIAAMAAIPFTGRPAADSPSSGPPVEELASVTIEVPRLCRRFGARVVRGISEAPTTERVRARLAAIGAKSISAAVDATNYVLWEIGQPLHAFDLDRLAGQRIVVRRARRGESLVTLDGVERRLEPSDVVVADAERAVSLAGIIGGLDTAVTRETRNVLLEAAWWDPAAIRRTSRRLGLHTDASHRFERGADGEAIPEALDRACAILLDSAGGTLAPGWIDAPGSASKRARVPLRLSRLRLLAGEDRLTLDFAAEALSRLGFGVSRPSARRLFASVPSWRPDVSIEDDLVEEVLRIYGYDRIPSRLPPAGRGGEHLEPLRVVEETLCDRAVAAGLLETMSAPFVDREREEAPFGAWLEALGSARRPLSVSNPSDETRRDLRSTLLPALLDAVARNVHRGEGTVALFEVGRVFDREGDPEDPPTFESRRFAFALCGDLRAHWSQPPSAARVDFFDAKGLIERLLSPWIEPDRLDWRPFTCPAFASGAAALVEAEGSMIGVVGLLSRSERERRKLTEPAFAGELRVDHLPRRIEPAHFAPYSSFPPVEADLTFAQEKETSWGRVDALVRGSRLSHLESVRLVDRYEGAGVPEGRVKTTIRLTFRSAERTLGQEEVNREVQRLRGSLERELGANF
jgi:phenylalanyl-tRNA synthetase beta chain